MEIESVKWWQSGTMRAAITASFGGLIALIVSVATLVGHPLDATQQLNLNNVLMALLNVVILAASAKAVLGRLKTDTVISGSSAEKKIVAVTGEKPPARATDSLSPLPTGAPPPPQGG